MTTCPHCRHENPNGHSLCTFCEQPLPGAGAARIKVRCLCGEEYSTGPENRGKKIKCPKCLRILTIGADPRMEAGPSASIRPKTSVGARKLVIIASICGALLAVDIAYQAETLSSVRRGLAREKEDRKSQHEKDLQEKRRALDAQIAAEQRTNQEQLEDHAIISGERALQRHQQEWSKRMAHDATMAKSVMEKQLLEMEAIGRDPSKSAKEALENVARLAAPIGSEIRVFERDDGFSIEVAFKMSALSAMEAGAVTKHHSVASMKVEIEELSARVIKSLFDYCGSRGIKNLSVTCNHAMRQAAVPINATPSERQQLIEREPVRLHRLYRVSLDEKQARSVGDWRKVPRSTVIELMNVEFDSLKNLTISGTLSGETADPPGPLEF